MSDQQEKGYKWWVRYVLVPLIGSGGLTAIIVALLIRPSIGAPGLTPANSETFVVQITSTLTDTLSPTDTPVCGQPEVQIKGNIPTTIFVGEEFALGAAASGRGLNYSWEGAPGEISDSHAVSIIYTAPQIAGHYVIRLQVDSVCGASNSDEISINVIPLPTPTPPLPTSTPTHTLAPKPRFSVNLKEPTDKSFLGTQQPIVFEWEFARALNPREGTGGEYFALNLWTDHTVKRSVSWIKETQYTIDFSGPVAVYTQLVECLNETGCYWSVDVIVSSVEKGAGYLPDSYTVITSSPTRQFFIRGAQPNPAPSPEPTDTPVPPTPCDPFC